MNETLRKRVETAKRAALEVLLHNRKGTYRGLPRTAGWGYPEPYTRDLMIASLGILASGNGELIASLRRTLVATAKNQSTHGHIPSLVHDPDDRGASDTTPLFLLAVALFRRVTDDSLFLDEAVQKALVWMAYQSPDDRVLVAQLPTSDWRDEQWVYGYGLYVNTLVHAYLVLYGETDRADTLRDMMSQLTVTASAQHRHVHEGLRIPGKSYYALWSYKVYSNERFDLLGNSLAVLTGLISRSRGSAMATWIERECAAMREHGQLAAELPPSLFPFFQPQDPDWRPRYAEYNQPGEYHNGGIWPFICGFYIAALVAAGRLRLAEQKLAALTDLVEKNNGAQVAFGFNEWVRAQDGIASGQDWQTWSASMYLYAAICVEERRTPFFDEIRDRSGVKTT